MTSSAQFLSRCYMTTMHWKVRLCKYAYSMVIDICRSIQWDCTPSLDILVHDINGRRQALALSFVFFLHVNIATYKRFMFAPDLSKDLPLPLCFHQLCVFLGLVPDRWSSMVIPIGPTRNCQGPRVPRVRTRMPTWVPKCLTRRDPPGVFSWSFQNLLGDPNYPKCLTISPWNFGISSRNCGIIHYIWYYYIICIIIIIAIIIIVIIVGLMTSSYYYELWLFFFQLNCIILVDIFMSSFDRPSTFCARRSPRGPLLRQDGPVVARVAEEAQEVTRGKGYFGGLVALMSYEIMDLMGFYGI